MANRPTEGNKNRRNKTSFLYFESLNSIKPTVIVMSSPKDDALKGHIKKRRIKDEEGKENPTNVGPGISEEYENM